MQKRIICGRLIATVLFAAAMPASATLLDAVNALDAGDQYRVLFVTSTTTDATSGSITDYNALVQSAASTGSVTSPLGLTWSALVSTTDVNVQTNTGILRTDTAVVKFFNAAGDLLAESGADFWDGNLDNPVLYDESGTAATGESVWTGNDKRGNSALELGGLLGTAITGSVDASTYAWVCCVSAPKQNQLHLYGASSLAIVSNVAAEPTTVAEPTTLAVLCTSLLGAGYARRRRTN